MPAFSAPSTGRPCRSESASAGSRAGGGDLDLRAMRPPERRQVGTCRDFALLLCSFLRVHRIPARVRCGFASYFGDGWWDHWICEYRTAEADAWLRADAELDGVMREACGITFDPTCMPPGAFLTAGEAWISCRAERLSFADVGHGEHRGPWFAGVNVVRDALSVNGRETSSWDRWRETPPDLRRVSADAEARLDGVARHPERPLTAADLPSLLA